MAFSLGALLFNISSLERHITLDRSVYSSDQAASLELSGMQTLSNSITKIVEAIGTNQLGVIHPNEISIAKNLDLILNN